MQLPMLILSLGVPRSGTILVFNVLREILLRQKVPFRIVNTNFSETEVFLKRYKFRINVLMHAHNVLPVVQEVLPRKDVVAFFNYRDPRDVMVSMMRLHDYTFEYCMKLTEDLFAQFNIARKFPQITIIPYDHLMSATDVLIFQIAQRLGVFLPLDVIAEIQQATSLDTHRRIMQQVVKGTIDVQQRRNPMRVLRESKTYFINDRHIQSGETGRWQKELTPDQQQAATDRFKSLLRELGVE